MKILQISDLHLGNHQYKLAKKFNNTFAKILADYMEGEDLEFRFLLIPGDLFEYPWVTNSVVSNFFKEVAKYKNDLRVIISSGNHDVSSVRKPTTLEMLSSAIYKPKCIECSRVDGAEIDVYDITGAEDLPPVLIVTEKPARFILNYEKVVIDALPYEFNGTGFAFNRKQKEVSAKTKNFKKILMCHGSIEGLDTVFEEKDLISAATIRGYDYVLKGHIHKTYSVQEKNIYSTGSLNRVEGSDECSYNLIDLVNDSIKNCPVPEDSLISYKLFENETEDTINDTLDSLTDNDVVMIYYSGRSEVIDQEKYYRCFHDCVKFAFIFNDSSIIRGNNVTSSDGGKFKSFYSYMSDFIAESKISDSVEKLYNDIKSNLNS